MRMVEVCDSCLLRLDFLTEHDCRLDVEKVSSKEVPIDGQHAKEEMVVNTHIVMSTG